MTAGGRLRVVLHAFGARGEELARCLEESPRFGLVAIAEEDSARRAVAAARAPAYASLEEALERGRPDAVLLAGAPRGRGQLVRIAAGTPGVKAVFAEKPADLRLDEARRAVETCAGARVLYVVGHHFPFTDELATLLAAVRAGRLGELRSIRGVALGNLFDQGSHLLDAARRLADGAPVLWASAQAEGDARSLSRFAGPRASSNGDFLHTAPAFVTAHLALAGGARVVLECGPLFQPDGAAPDDWHQRRLEVAGTAGTAWCRPGHRLVLRADGAPAAVTESPAGALVRATARMLDDFATALDDGRLPAGDAAGDLATLEGLLLCGASVLDGGLATAPLSPSRDVAGALVEPRTRAAPAAPESRFSILFLVPEHRGHAEAALAAWTRHQRFPPGRFEVLLLEDGTEPELVRSLRALLRPEDRVVSVPNADSVGLARAGAARATGDVLVFAESHVEPEPEYLAEMEAALSRTGADAAVGRTLPIDGSALARADARLFEGGFERVLRERSRPPLVFHAVAIRRRAFEEAGGLDPELGRFAEEVLEARLAARGAPVTYARGAAVRHHYRETRRDLTKDVATFVRGAVAWRARRGVTRPPSLVAWQDRWVDPALFAPGVAGALARAVLAEAARRPARRHAVALARLALAAAGPRVFEAAEAIGVAAWGAATLLARPWPRALDATIRRFHAHAVRRVQVAAVAERLPLPGAGRGGRADELEDDDLVGVRPLVLESGTRLRWTAPLAAVRLSLRAGDHRLVVETAERRDDLPGSTAAWLDGRVRLAARLERGGVLVLDLPAGATGEHVLVLLTRPRGGDPRSSGLPLAALRVEGGSGLSAASS